MIHGTGTPCHGRGPDIGTCTQQPGGFHFAHDYARREKVAVNVSWLTHCRKRPGATSKQFGFPQEARMQALETTAVTAPPTAVGDTGKELFQYDQAVVKQINRIEDIITNFAARG
jgi:hypothetical protein